MLLIQQLAAAGEQASGSPESNISSTGNDITILSSYSHETLQDFELDHDFYPEFWFKCLISLLLLLTLELVTWISSYLLPAGASIIDVILYNAFSWLLLTAPLSLYCFTLFSITAPRLQTARLAKATLTHWSIYILVTMCFVMLTILDFFSTPVVYLVIKGDFGIRFGPPELILFALLGVYNLGSSIVAASYFFK